MDQSPFWEADRSSASQIPCTLWNTKVHYRIHKFLPPVAILNQIDSAHASAFHFLKINVNIILPSTSRSFKWSCSPRSSHQTLYATFLSPILTTYIHAPGGIRTHIPTERPQTYALHRASTGVSQKWNDVGVKWPSFPLHKFAGSVYLVVQGQSLSNEVERHQVER